MSESSYFANMLYRGAAYMTKNKAYFFTAAAVKGSIFAGGIVLYEEYKRAYGPPSQPSNQNSFGVDLVEDIALSAVMTLGMFLMAKQYMKHESWHPKSAASSSKSDARDEKVQQDTFDHSDSVSEYTSCKSSRTRRERMSDLSSMTHQSLTAAKHSVYLGSIIS
jgi:hypothetical protein